jgi:hypothetical protein
VSFALSLDDGDLRGKHMTAQEWDAAWVHIQEIMDSENGEESMPYLHELARSLSKCRPIGTCFPIAASSIKRWRDQNGLTQAFLERLRRGEL